VRRSFAARLVSPLLDYDRRHQSELVRTLGIFLDCAGSWNACAEQLHVHLNTVRYRIRRIEELTGRNLSTMADLADLFPALSETGAPCDQGGKRQSLLNRRRRRPPLSPLQLNFRTVALYPSSSS
jgi:hypothetical protein